MKHVLFLAIALNIFTGIGTAVGAEDDYEQTYVIFLNGERSGKEIVSEKTAGNGDLIAQSESELYISDGLETNRMAYETRMVLDGESMKPKTYILRYVSGSSGDHYEVTVQGDTVVRTLSRGGESTVATGDFKPDSVILDVNVYHQYDYVIRKYDMDKGGRQLFSDFIPVIGRDIPIALTYLGESSLPHRKSDLLTRKFQIEFIGLRNGTVTTDSDGRLVRLVMPEQNLEVVREDLLPANR